MARSQAKGDPPGPEEPAPSSELCHAPLPVPAQPSPAPPRLANPRIPNLPPETEAPSPTLPAHRSSPPSDPPTQPKGGEREGSCQRKTHPASGRHRLPGDSAAFGTGAILGQEESQAPSSPPPARASPSEKTEAHLLMGALPKVPCHGTQLALIKKHQPAERLAERP